MKLAKAHAIEEWKSKKESRLTNDTEVINEDETGIYQIEDVCYQNSSINKLLKVNGNKIFALQKGADQENEDSDSDVEMQENRKQIYTSHVPVPSQKDVEDALLRKKKQELLEKYGCLDVKLEETN